MPEGRNIYRIAKILSGDQGKNSYERRVYESLDDERRLYESVDDESLS